MDGKISIRLLEPDHYQEWMRMRQALWLEFSPDFLAEEIREILADLDNLPVFVAVRPDGACGGFVEAAIRPYADGCDTRSAGYIEAWYVDPDLRLQGIGAALIAAAEDWARRRGCQEMASDCLIDNLISLQAHLALGYQEKVRLIHFCKRL